VTTVIVIIVVLVIAALLAAAFMAAQNRRRAQLQERFGPEYDRAVDESGSQREADRHLAAVAHKRDKLEIRELDASERGRYTDEWDVVQSRFVDEPAQAVDSAETLIGTVMRERGYPVEDFDEQADLVAADHPEVVSEYRAAHVAHERHRASGSLDTEDLRQAFVHYRTLFVSLVQPETVHAPAASTPVTEGTEVPADEAPADRPVEPAGATDSIDPVESAGATPTATTGTRPAGAEGDGAALGDSYHPQETR
jgi:hypothetical protein